MSKYWKRLDEGFLAENTYTAGCFVKFHCIHTDRLHCRTCILLIVLGHKKVFINCKSRKNMISIKYLKVKQDDMMDSLQPKISWVIYIEFCTVGCNSYDHIYNYQIRS